MNNKGSTSVGILVAVLLVIGIIMGVFFNPMLNLTLNVENSKDIIPNYINNINGMERLYSVLQNNISHNSDVIFEDIDKEYNIEELTAEYENITVGKKFTIENKTDITVNMEIQPISQDEPYYYDIKLILNEDKVVFNKTNLTNNSTMTVNSDFLYNQETGEINYGDFEIIVDSNNCNVSVKTEYDLLVYREINVSNKNINQNIGINNTTRDIYIIQEGVNY